MFATQQSPISWLIRAQTLATAQLLESVSQHAKPLSAGLISLCLQAEEELQSRLKQIAEGLKDPQAMLEVNCLESRRSLEMAWGHKVQEDDPPANSQPVAQKESQQLSVLIIDDDADNLLVAQYVTEDLGYRVTTSLSGHDAVSAAIACNPDIILLDIWLDGITGVDVFHQLRAHPEFTGVPVIAVTALALPTERAKIMSVGFADYVIKPYLVDDLSQAIKRHLP